MKPVRAFYFYSAYYSSILKSAHSTVIMIKFLVQKNNPQSINFTERMFVAISAIFMLSWQSSLLLVLFICSKTYPLPQAHIHIWWFISYNGPPSVSGTKARNDLHMNSLLLLVFSSPSILLHFSSISDQSIFNIFYQLFLRRMLLVTKKLEIVGAPSTIFVIKTPRYDYCSVCPA